jgi:hypothetical protein
VGVARCGDHIAATDPGTWALESSTRELVGYIYTDNSIYRPGQTVHAKAIVRLRYQAQQRQRTHADAYTARNRSVAALAWLELRLGLRAGLGRHAPDPDPTWDPQWFHVVYVDLPEGQVSWHVHDRDVFLFADLPPYDYAWDGHGTEERHRRLATLGM